MCAALIKFLLQLGVLHRVRVMLRLWALKKRPPLRHTRKAHSTVSRNAADTSLVAASEPPAKWTPNSVRTGLIARKRGVTAMWDDHGVRFPITVLQVSTDTLFYHGSESSDVWKLVGELSSDS